MYITTPSTPTREDGTAGAAFGGGLELALACDLRVADTQATLCFPECSLGLFPGAAGCVLVTRLVGAARAKDLLFTSRRFTYAA